MPGLESHGNENSLDGIPGVCRLGDYTPTAGFNFPVYLTFKNDPDELLESVRNISLLGQAPYALIIPTRKQLTPRTEDLLNRSGSICIVLSEEFSIQSNGSLKALRPATDVFAAFQADVPEPDSGGMVHFDTPPVSAGTVSPSSLSTGIRFRSVQPNHTASTITPRWEWPIPETGTRPSLGSSSEHLLNHAARLIGRASTPPQGQGPETTTIEKLREFFRLTEDPIEYLKEEGSYRCLFTIKPEGDDEYA